ncbi:MAG: SCP-2 family sterol carrier protein [Deltaproteobacteria bacterium]|nr:MAG: SCP-2 family sterol carrier protein [Deltaproteobacteria bacterium]
MKFQSAKEVFDKMSEFFDSEAAAGAKVIYQFHITDADPADYTVAIENGALEVSEGIHENPTLTLSMLEENWLKLVEGKLNPAMAFMSGKIKAKGDLFIAQKFGTYFKLS